ncbi:MAG: hypothetical protein GY950_28635 [bacterium]|nr:hypothetical protein [bacterium]
MKRITIMILAMIACIALNSLNLDAAQSVTFLKDGKSITDTIVDMSSHTGQVDYRRSGKVHRKSIWMINFENGKWDFPRERTQLAANRDTIFLRNGHTLNVNIVDFSSRRQMFEFRKGGAVHESKVKRIYFCCTKLPAAYSKAAQKERTPARKDDFKSTTFIVDGRTVKSPLTYINSRKSGFKNKLQINTKDIWMINFQNDSMNFPKERTQLDPQLDTIFLKNGEVIYDTVLDFSSRRNTFRFNEIDPIHHSEIKRIYFCCTKFPRLFQNKVRNPRYKNKYKRRIR